MISQRKWESIRERMGKLGIAESDLEESFVRSSGRGGQNVNKVSTCVQITYKPSGVSVRCQVSRSQAENRFFARRILCEKIETIRLGKKSEEGKRHHRIRAQKRRRSRRAKEKMLQAKRLHSEKKELRKPPGW